MAMLYSIINGGRVKKLELDSVGGRLEHQQSRQEILRGKMATVSDDCGNRAMKKHGGYYIA